MSPTLTPQKSQQTLTRLRSKLVRRLVKKHLELPENKKPSVAVIANVFEVSRQHMDDLLGHRALPSLPLALRMSATLRVSTDSLFGPDDEEG